MVHLLDYRSPATRSAAFCSAVMAFITLATSGVASEPISITSLLEEMVDREKLARLPEPAYRCLQASSYDRDSDDPNDESTWYANLDRSQFIRSEQRDGRTEHVLMDAEGPGAVVRFWATWHGPGGGKFSDGTVRVYFDGESNPTIEGPMSEFVSKGMLAGPPLSQSVSIDTEYERRGHNLFLPLPYAKGCKITYSTDVLIDRGAREGEALYYQVNYRQYDEAVEVQTFTMEDHAAAKPTIAKVGQQLADRARGDGSDWSRMENSGSLEPGTEIEMARVEGPGAIRNLMVKLAANELPQALRSTVLKIEFDGLPTVWTPVGDFFGTGYKIRPYNAWYTQVTGDREMLCWWVMPYQKSATISLVNTGDQTVTFHSETATSAWDWDTRSMHFASTWQQYSNLDTRVGDKPAGEGGAFDVNYVTIEGSGVYVGDSLTLFNGGTSWWGEGDEKIYIDGESFPSHFGTGTEDYYGYAWCRPEFFDAPFHAQPDGQGNLDGGFVVNSRWRSLDAIPFERSLRVDMEMWHWVETKVNFAPATFFYASPGAQDNVEPAIEEAAKPVVLRRAELVEVFYADGVIEGEELKVTRLTGGEADPQRAGQYGWSGEAQLWWITGKPGDEMEVVFEAKESGPQRVTANLTKANDYAIIETTINDQATSAGEIDRYHPSVDHDLIDLGVHDLLKGENRLSLRIVGINEDAFRRYMVGIDYLKLQPVD